MKEKGERKRRGGNEKTRKKTIKGLVNFLKFVIDDVVEPGKERWFNLAARNVKQDIINTHS